MRIGFYFFYAFTRLFGLMPFWLIHLFSNVLAFLFYSVIPYRKKVIWQNIERSFPDLTDRERNVIIKGFYHNFCDILLEGMKGFTISKKELMKRYVFVNPEVMNDLYEEGVEIISVGAHYANWEWGIMAAPLHLKHKLNVLYTPMSNKPIDKYMRMNRKKWGSDLVAVQKVKSVFDAEKENPESYFFAADQSPHGPKGSHWMKFLNQDTACLKGPEFFARRYKMPVVYFDVQRIKKGYYTVTLKVIENNPIGTGSGEITEKFMHALEKIIVKKPEDYLWSHRRWKHKRESKEIA